MTASGTFGYGLEFADFVPLDGIGGIIVKGTTLHAREGNDYPRMVETPKGMLNCVGLQNKGVDYFCDHIYPSVKDMTPTSSSTSADPLPRTMRSVPLASMRSTTSPPSNSTSVART